MSLFIGKVKFSLFLKFTLVITLTLILILSLMGRIITNYTESSLISEQKKSNEIVTNLIAKISSSPIERLDYASLEGYSQNLENVIETPYHNSEILSVIFYDKHGNKINLKNTEHEHIELPKHFWDIQESVILGETNEILGKVKMVFSLESIYDTTKKITNNFNIAIVVLLLVLIAVITLLLLIIIIIPLKKLTGAVDSMSKGNFHFRIGYHSNDEIGFLGNTFRKMRKELKQSFQEIKNRKQELKDYNMHLGEMVEKRTEQLKKAHDELKERNDQMLSDLQMARSVQLNIIPKDKDFPKRKELQFGYKYSSMESVGGDLYDVIHLDKNRYGFLIADVSGHGVPAALITSMAKVSFSSNSNIRMSTADVCSKVNNELCSLIGNLTYFISAYYCTIDLESGELEYTNGGHHPALLLPTNEKKIRKLDTDGFVLGSFEDIDFENKKILLNEGDRILLFTDGIIEARNEDTNIYGYKRLMKFIHNNYYLSPEEFVNMLGNDIDKHCGKRPQDDDRAILCIEFKSKIGNGKSLEEALSVEVRTN